MKIRCKFLYFIFVCFFISVLTVTHGLETSDCIDVRNLEISWINGLNNNIRIINFHDGMKYFKECKKKVDSKTEVHRILEEYFEEYLPDYVPSDKELLIKALDNSENVGKFINAGFMWDKESCLYRYINGEIDCSYLGIPVDVAEQLTINLEDLFLYSSRDLVHRCISSGIKNGEHQVTLAVKQLATYKLAKYLGIENIVVKSDFVELVTNYGNKIGILTAQTDGVDIAELKNTSLTINPQFQQELTSLQVLDTITGEQDHNPGNCSFKIDQNQLVGVMAFDNECGFGLNTNLQKGLCWGKTSPLLTSQNKINLPHMDKNLAEKILSTEEQDIDETLENILSENQLSSLKSRFNQVKSAIANTITENSSFLLDNVQWSEDTLKAEIYGDYGHTYLYHYLKNLNLLNI